MYSAMPIQAVSSGVGVSCARSREICVCTSSPPPPGHCTYTRRLPILEQRHPGQACPILPFLPILPMLGLFCPCLFLPYSANAGMIQLLLVKTPMILTSQWEEYCFSTIATVHIPSARLICPQFAFSFISLASTLLIMSLDARERDGYLSCDLQYYLEPYPGRR